jgi:hypothetical protein
MDETQKVLDKPLVLALLEPGGTLLQYVTATTQVISAALVVEREEPGHLYKVQRPVYYITKVLSNCETCYNHVQKLLYAVIILKRKLLHYFESHLIRVVTSFGLREIIKNRLSTERIAKWALELMGST